MYYFLLKKKDEAQKNKPVQLIKYGAESSSDVDGSPEVYPLPVEGASDSSNISEEATVDNSFDRDVSPLARRRFRVNRAHRSRVARSEYFSPEDMTSLATQGRSRSLDAREFINELGQGQTSTPEEHPELNSSSSMTVIRPRDHTLDTVDSPRQMVRTQSFNLDRGNEDSGKSIEAKPTGTVLSPARTPEKPTGTTPTQGQPGNTRKISDDSRKSSVPSSENSRSSSLCSGDVTADVTKAVVRHVGSTPRMTRAKNIDQNQLIEKQFRNDDGNGREEMVSRVSID